VTCDCETAVAKREVNNPKYLLIQMAVCLLIKEKMKQTG
jgi:hypothetical protein